ncbi:MAG: phospholipid carrier-dependent glycosyltransferase [Anaerolineales bacterium]
MKIRVASNYKIAFILGLFMIAGASAILVIAMTHWGPGLFDLDSFNYLGSARSFASGNGVQIPVSPTSLRPMLNFAPLFAVILAVFEFLGADAMAAARWLNAILFGVNLLLFAVLVFKSTGSRRLTLAASFIFFLSPDLLEAHAWVLSEPLLITFMLSSLLAFVMWQTSHKRVWVVVFCASIGLGVLTKFVAAAIIPPFVILLMLGQARWRTRLAYSFITVLAGLVPFSMWSLRSFLLSDSFHGFTFSYIPLERGNLISAFFTMHTWFVPESLLFGREIFVLLLVIILILTAGFYLYRKAQKEGVKNLTVPLFTALLFVFYLSVVIFAKVMFDHGVGFQDRMFIPLFPFLLVTIVIVAHHIFEDIRPWGRWVVLATIGYLAIISFIGSFVSLPVIYEEGLGWNARRIVSSPALAKLKAISTDPEVQLFNNEPYGMFFHTGQVGNRLKGFPPAEKAYLVLFKIHRDSEHPLPSRYPEELELIAEDEILSIHLFDPN